MAECSLGPMLRAQLLLDCAVQVSHPLTDAGTQGSVLETLNEEEFQSTLAYFLNLHLHFSREFLRQE